MATTDAALFTYPLARSVPTEPPAEYARLRADRPVCPITLATGYPAWMVTRYDDVRAVLGDPRFSRAALLRPGAVRNQAADPDPHSMVNMDPPRHTALRRLVGREFTPARVELMRPAIEAFAAELLDRMAGMTPPVDLNTCLSRPLALRVICTLLGVPFADHPRFADWCDHFMSLTKYPPEEVARVAADMRRYFVGLIAGKRADPGDDLLSALTGALNRGAITEPELVSLGVLLLMAGHDTTVTVLGGAVITLLRNPGQLAALRADPAGYRLAVEELARLNEPGDGSFIRVALEDVVVADTVIRAGETVIAALSSANRDGAVFADPDACDVGRDPNPHMAFGHGPHYCLGANLARVELEIGLRGLFGRIPALRLAVPVEALRWKRFAALGGWEEVPVTW